MWIIFYDVVCLGAREIKRAQWRDGAKKELTDLTDEDKELLNDLKEKGADFKTYDNQSHTIEIDDLIQEVRDNAELTAKDQRVILMVRKAGVADDSSIAQKLREAHAAAVSRTVAGRKTRHAVPSIPAAQIRTPTGSPRNQSPRELNGSFGSSFRSALSWKTETDNASPPASVPANPQEAIKNWDGSKEQLFRLAKQQEVERSETVDQEALFVGDGGYLMEQGLLLATSLIIRKKGISERIVVTETLQTGQGQIQQERFFQELKDKIETERDKYIVSTVHLTKLSGHFCSLVIDAKNKRAFVYDTYTGNPLNPFCCNCLLRVS